MRPTTNVRAAGVAGWPRSGVCWRNQDDGLVAGAVGILGEGRAQHAEALAQVGHVVVVAPGADAGPARALGEVELEADTVRGGAQVAQLAARAW